MVNFYNVPPELSDLQKASPELFDVVTKPRGTSARSREEAERATAAYLLGRGGGSYGGQRGRPGVPEVALEIFKGFKNRKKSQESCVIDRNIIMRLEQTLDYYTLGDYTVKKTSNEIQRLRSRANRATQAVMNSMIMARHQNPIYARTVSKKPDAVTTAAIMGIPEEDVFIENMQGRALQLDAPTLNKNYQELLDPKNRRDIGDFARAYYVESPSDEETTWADPRADYPEEAQKERDMQEAMSGLESLLKTLNDLMDREVPMGSTTREDMELTRNHLEDLKVNNPAAYKATVTGTAPHVIALLIKAEEVYGDGIWDVLSNLNDEPDTPDEPEKDKGDPNLWDAYEDWGADDERPENI